MSCLENLSKSKTCSTKVFPPNSAYGIYKERLLCHWGIYKPRRWQRTYSDRRLLKTYCIVIFREGYLDRRHSGNERLKTRGSRDKGQTSASWGVKSDMSSTTWNTNTSCDRDIKTRERTNKTKTTSSLRRHDVRDVVPWRWKSRWKQGINSCVELWSHTSSFCLATKRLWHRGLRFPPCP